VTAPVRTSALGAAHLALLVAGDATARAARLRGDEVEWRPPVLAGDLAGQRAVERALAREGLDRAAVGREAFVERVRAAEAEGAAALTELLATLGADAVPYHLDEPASSLAARVAFVRLFEGGLLQRAERVVGTCPRCETVVGGGDADPVELDAQRLVLRLPLVPDPGGTPPGPEAPSGGAEAADGEGRPDVLVVATTVPELLPGAAAVVVPVGHPAAGRSAVVPLGDPSARAVPVLAADVAEPAILVPAHDEEHRRLAARLGVTGVDVLDPYGNVVSPGALVGLARYAARAAASATLEAEGMVGDRSPAVEAARRCRRCGTVLFDLRGTHWFLPMADLEQAAADVLRQGGVRFQPPTAVDEVLARAGQGGDWCLSHQVWAGQPVPVARCLDCGAVQVEVGSEPSCKACMGTLDPDDGALDARFVGALWPLDAGGWPGTDPDPPAPGATTLLVTNAGALRWALPMAALGLRLTGRIPFDLVAVHPVDPDRADEPVPVVVDDPLRLRLAALGGDAGDRLATAMTGAVDPEATIPAAVTAAVLAALDVAQPADAVAALASVLGDSGAPSDLIAVVRPLVGHLQGRAGPTGPGPAHPSPEP
jgi:valyl-tRNA synthetase